MQFTDSLILSRLGDEALAAVTPAGMMILVLLAFGSGTMGAVNTFVGQAHGHSESSKCGQFLWSGIWLAVFLGIGSLLFYPTANVIFGQFFNHEFGVFEKEVVYFQISLFSILPLLIADAIGMFFLAIGRTRLPMIATLISTLTNVVLSWILVFGHFGFSEMGMAGAAWASVVASILNALILLCFLLPGELRKRFHTLPSLPKRRHLRRLIKIGAPAGIQEAVDLISWGVLLIWLIGKFGTDHLAAATILLRCMQVSFLPSDGIGIAISAMVANSIGAEKFRLARSQAALGLRVAMTYMGSLALLFILLRSPIIAVFTDSPRVAEIASTAIFFVAAFQIFDAMNLLYVNALQGAGDTYWPSAVNTVLSVVVLLGGGLLAVHAFPQFQSFGVWAVATLYIMIQGLLFRWRWKNGDWQLLQLLP